MAFGKDFYLKNSSTAPVADSAKYVFCALVSDKSTLTFDPKFCSDEVGKSVSLMEALEVCKVSASQQTGIGNLLPDTKIKYYLMQATGGRWIAIKRKKDNKGFSVYNPMGNAKETIDSSAALTEMLQKACGIDDQTSVIAVKAE